MVIFVKIIFILIGYKLLSIIRTNLELKTDVYNDEDDLSNVLGDVDSSMFSDSDIKKLKLFSLNLKILYNFLLFISICYLFFNL